MKRYKAIYWDKEKQNLHQLSEISKSGKENGSECSFCYIKLWQRKIKNGIANGITASKCWDTAQNNYIRNNKKGIIQGILITFKQ